MFIELQHTFAFICKPSTSPCFTSLTAMTPWYSRYIFNWVPGLLGKKIQNLWSLAKVWDYMTHWKKNIYILRLDEEFARPALSCGGTIWLSFLSSFYCMKDFSDVWYHASVKEPSTKVPQSANTIMWRFIPPVIPLKNLHKVVLRSSVNTVKLYHAKSGCFGYRPAPQIIHAGQL